MVAGLAAATVQALEAPVIVPLARFAADRRCGLFHHSNTRLSPRAERILSWIVATPKMHAIHHSIDPAQLHSNFSSGLAIWDRIHGTARFDAA